MIRLKQKKELICVYKEINENVSPVLNYTKSGRYSSFVIRVHETYGGKDKVKKIAKSLGHEYILKKYGKNCYIWGFTFKKVDFFLIASIRGITLETIEPKNSDHFDNLIDDFIIALSKKMKIKNFEKDNFQD